MSVGLVSFLISMHICTPLSLPLPWHPSSDQWWQRAETEKYWRHIKNLIEKRKTWRKKSEDFIENTKIQKENLNEMIFVFFFSVVVYQSQYNFLKKTNVSMPNFIF